MRIHVYFMWCVENLFKERTWEFGFDWTPEKKELNFSDNFFNLTNQFYKCPFPEVTCYTFVFRRLCSVPQTQI